MVERHVATERIAKAIVHDGIEVVVAPVALLGLGARADRRVDVAVPDARPRAAADERRTASEEEKGEQTKEGTHAMAAP
jgi:hypothetical protein